MGKRSFAAAVFLFLSIVFPVLSYSQPADDVNKLTAEFARLYKERRYQEAIPVAEKILAIRENTLGPVHPGTATAINNLAGLYAATGRLADSLSPMLRAQAIDGRLIDQVMGFTSEDRKMKFLATKENNLYAFLALASRYMKDKRDAANRLLTVWLQRKGVVFEAQKRFQDALTPSGDPKVREKAQELARVRAQLSKLTFSGPGKEMPDVHRKKITELSEVKKRYRTTNFFFWGAFVYLGEP